MLKHILTALIIGSMAFTVSCGSKKKKSGDGAGGDPGSSIETSDIKMDDRGSDGGQIVGLNTINFEYDRAALNTDSRQRLAENATWIQEHKNYVIQIEGHCDSRGSVEYNLALGERRAKSVKNYLVSLGVDPKNMTIISYGKEKPLAFGDSESDYAKNRRANFVPMKQ